MDYSSFDMTNIVGILMSTTSDFTIRKSCLDQLAVLLFDVTNKRGRNLLKNTGGSVKDVFTFVIEETLTAYNTCQNYLR